MDTPAEPSFSAETYFALLQNREIPIIIDDERIRGCVTELGFSAIHYDHFEFLSERKPFFVLLSTLQYHDKLMELWNRINTVVSHVALAKFDNSTECIDYSLKQFLSIDYQDTLRRRAEYYERVLSCNHVDVVTPAGVLTCHLNEAIEVANDDMGMKPGWLYSAAEFLETSIVNLESGRSSFWLEGRFSFDGIVYLFNNEALRAEYGSTFDSLLRSTQRGNNYIEYQDNTMARVVVGGEDITDMFTRLIRGKERESAPSEFAFGCVNYGPAQNWGLNSLMHESSHGVHVGVGMSQQIPHVDFIAKGAVCRFVE
jgi:hypothetical protein